MSLPVLLVDDDPNVLAAYQRQLRKHLVFETAAGGDKGLETLAQRGPFAVVVSDMYMPRMNGIEFLQKVRSLAPDTVRMMLTGAGDLHTAVKAVNEGSVFRFLTKPCSSDALLAALQAGIEQHRLVTAERELLDQTLRNSLKVLAEVLSLSHPTTFGRARRAQQLAVRLANELGEDNSWRLEVAATLSQIGCVAVPEEILRKVDGAKPLTPAEQATYDDHPRLAAQLLRQIPRLEGVAEAVAHQQRRYDGADAPDGPRGNDLPLASRVLKVALDYDALIEAGHPSAQALTILAQRLGAYDPRILETLGTAVRATAAYQSQTVSTRTLKPGMILDQNLVNQSGQLIARKGYEVTLAAIQRLQQYALDGVLEDSICVLVPNK